ncbi:uncharacterized protein V1516DRAFT_446603 [Lipomyces oligophaga]|uniref:uncharacterized protein n=1 Tax=Lipomyces oligophaga TaxID=45792 RepID=UPI0034CFC89A
MEQLPISALPRLDPSVPPSVSPAPQHHQHQQQYLPYPQSRPYSPNTQPVQTLKPSSTASSTNGPYRRSYKACLHCRERKVKCDLGSLDNPSDPPCARCKREGRKCEFVPSRRGGAKNIRAGKAKQLSEAYLKSAAESSANNDDEDDDEDDDDEIVNEDYSTDDPDRLKQDNKKRKARHQQITGSLIKDHGLHTSVDALNILAHVADSAEESRNENRDPEILNRSLGNSDSSSLSFSSSGSSNSSASSSQSSKRARQGEFHARWTFRSAKLNTFIPIQQNMISEDEVLCLLSFFFETLHPFYPYIPPGLQPPTNLAAHPILLVTILSIASRYCALPEKDPNVSAAGNPYSVRSREIHSALWTYGESLISQTVWAEASSISLATVLAFLLLSQWNPRAVHYRNGDYANPTNLSSNDEDGRGPEGGGGYGGFAAARRSDRMAWMMIGVAIRLAQDMNLFSKWREIALACFYSDITLAIRLGRPSMLSYSFQEMPTVTFSALDNAKLEILRILSFAHQSLYSSPGSMYKILNSENYLPLLRFFRSKLQLWHAKYYHLIFKDETCLDSECLLMEFYYSELYVYSLALSPPGHRQADEELAELYILYATQSAQQCIAVIERLHRLRLLKNAPIQWFVRAIHVAIFLAKVIVLEREKQRDRQLEIIGKIRGLANILSQSSPDDIHLATKYAAALLRLCDNIELELNKKSDIGTVVSVSTASVSKQLEKNLDFNINAHPSTKVEKSKPDMTSTVSDAVPSSGTEAAPGSAVEANMFPYAATDMENMKWIVDSYGLVFDGNYGVDSDWISPPGTTLATSSSASGGAVQAVDESGSSARSGVGMASLGLFSGTTTNYTLPPSMPMPLSNLSKSTDVAAPSRMFTSLPPPQTQVQLPSLSGPIPSFWQPQQQHQQHQRTMPAQNENSTWHGPGAGHSAGNNFQHPSQQ